MNGDLIIVSVGDCSASEEKLGEKKMHIWVSTMRERIHQRSPSCRRRMGRPEKARHVRSPYISAIRNMLIGCHRGKIGPLKALIK